MNRKDYFAAKAMQAFVSQFNINDIAIGGDHFGKKIAPIAFDVAEAMIKESERRKDKNDS